MASHMEPPFPQDMSLLPAVSASWHMSAKRPTAATFASSARKASRVARAVSKDARIAPPWSVLGEDIALRFSLAAASPATLRTRIDGPRSVAPDQRLSLAISVKVASAASRMRAMVASS